MPAGSTTTSSWSSATEPLPDQPPRRRTRPGRPPRPPGASSVPQLADSLAAARRPPRLRGAARADQRRRRHGRRRHDQPARTGRGGPQLRLPLRVDPRPVLRRAGRRRRTARTRCSTTRSRFVTDRLLDDGPNLTPAYTDHGRPRARPAHAATCPAIPAARDIVGNRVNAQFQLDAFGEALLLFAAAARHDRLDTDALAAPSTAAVARSQHRWTEPDAGIWEIDDRRWTHSPADLRRRAARRRRRGCPAARRGAGWIALADAIVADTAARRLHPDGRWQRAPDDPRRRRRAAAARPSAARCPPTTRARVATLRGRAPTSWPRTATSTASATTTGPLGDAEGAFLLCGFLDGAGRPTSRATTVGAIALVRTQPGRLRAARAVHRGVRRHPAPAARQPAAGLRARPDARGLGATDRALAEVIRLTTHPSGEQVEDQPRRSARHAVEVGGGIRSYTAPGTRPRRLPRRRDVHRGPRAPADPAARKILYLSAGELIDPATKTLYTATGCRRTIAACRPVRTRRGFPRRLPAGA